MPGAGSVHKVRTKTKLSDGTVRIRYRWVAQLSQGPRGAVVLTRRYAPWNDNTRARAKLLLEAILSEHRAADPRMTLGEYLPRWLARYGQRVGASQAANAGSIVRVHLMESLRQVRLVDLRPSTVEAALADVARRPSTVRHVYNVLAVALDDAVRDDLIPYNPVRRVARPSVPKARKPPWSLDEVQRFLQAAATQGDPYEALFVLAAATGLRQGELLGLAWGDVDLDSGRVTVALQLARREGRYVRVPRKSGGEAYTAHLPAVAVEALRAHRERQPVTPLDGGLVFVTERGRPVSGSVVTHRLQRIAEAAGLPHGDFHGLRRFRASLAGALGVNPVVTQAALGHANVTTTLGSYIYGDDTQAVAAAALVDDALRRVG